MLRQDDANYKACIEAAQTLAYPFLTSWAVITEAAWLLRNTSDDVSRLLDQLDKGLVIPLDLDAIAIPWIRSFLEKYRDWGAQFADATLCHLGEREGIESIFILDRRDFSVYRTRQNRAFRLLPK